MVVVVDNSGEIMDKYSVTDKGDISKGEWPAYVGDSEEVVLFS